MPNWCENHVVIECPSKADYDAVVDATQGLNYEGEHSLFTFNVLVPVPEILELDWLMWSYANWGCSRDAVDVDLDTDGEQTLDVRFMTSWAPPEAYYRALSAKFPSVDISWFYCEDMMQIAGYLNNE